MVLRDNKFTGQQKHKHRLLVDGKCQRQTYRKRPQMLLRSENSFLIPCCAAFSVLAQVEE